MIELKHLTKKYDHFLAVEDLNLKIETGEFFGLLGPNGAGKTTTIGMLSTLLLPTSGEIWINGELLTRQKNQLKQKLSVVTQEYSMRQDMTMNEIMEYQGRLYYMPIKKIRERSEELLEFCGLIDYRKRTVRKLSDCRDGCIFPPSDVESSEKAESAKAYHSSDNALYGGSRNAL